MLGNYVHYFVMFSLSEAYEILSCDFLENAAAPASAGLRSGAARWDNVLTLFYMRGSNRSSLLYYRTLVLRGCPKLADIS